MSQPIIKICISNCGLEGEIFWGNVCSLHGYNEKRTYLAATSRILL